MNTKKTLLGKKHKKEEEEQEEEEKEEKEEKKSESDSKSSSSEENDDKPVKSIFANPEKELSFNSKGLFPSSSKDNKNSLFGNPISSEKGAFGDLSNPIKNPVSLFGSSNDNLIKKDSSLFSSGLFAFTNNINKEENNNDNSNSEGEDDNIGKSNSPNPYDPEKEIEKDNKDEKNKNGFKKIYVKRIDDFYEFNKEEKKYISKGNGFISIEIKQDDDKKRFATLIFRNIVGNTLLNGILNEKISKFESYEKKFKHVAHIIVIKKENTKENSICISNIKIPFMKNEELELFENKYKNAIKFINNEIEIDDIKKNEKK
jgi:hypothetical protein